MGSLSEGRPGLALRQWVSGQSSGESGAVSDGFCSPCHSMVWLGLGNRGHSGMISEKSVVIRAGTSHLELPGAVSSGLTPVNSPTLSHTQSHRCPPL